MTKYLDPSFTVAVGTKEYREGWERIFGKKPCQGCKDCSKDCPEKKPDAPKE